MTFLSALLLFGFLIFIHELGHFILAKLSGVRVDKFSLGFGPRLVGRKIGETEYLVSAIPLGGYVKMMGEEADDEVEPSQKARSYKEQPVLKRASIVFAGPLFNLLTAVVIFFFVYLTGFPTLLPVIGEIMPETPASRSVLRTGDMVAEINGTPLRQWQEMTNVIYANPGKELTFTLKRGTETITTVITPEPKKMKDLFGEEREVGLIGVKPSGDTSVVREDLPGAAMNAVHKTWEIASLTVIGIVKLVQRIVPADTIGGPILIFQLAEKQASAGGLSFFTFAAVISVNLAVLNLLPIPVLDGGHLLFLGMEAVRRKPLSERAVAISQRIGIALILFLMAFAMYNDIFRLITGRPIP